MLQVGTTAYMAPERLKGDEYSYSSDVWAVGVIVLEVRVHALHMRPMTSIEPMHMHAQCTCAPCMRMLTDRCMCMVIYALQALIGAHPFAEHKSFMSLFKAITSGTRLIQNPPVWGGSM